MMSRDESHSKRIFAIITIAKFTVAAAALAALAGLSQSAVSAETTAKVAQMSPGKALELQIGDQHAISYFEPGQDGCGLTIVLATGKEGQGGVEAHGTRVVIPLAPGKTVRIDGTERRSADSY